MRFADTSRTIVPCCALLLSVTVAGVQADVAPPVKISMPRDTLPATSGVEYEGVFTVDVGEAGTLSDFDIHGQGWTILEVGLVADPVWVERGLFDIPFRALPADADQLIHLTLNYDGRRVARSLRIGSAAFARRGKDRPSVQVSAIGRPANAPPIGAEEDESQPADATRGDLTLRFTGRIVYDRPTAMNGNACGAPLGTPAGTSEEGVHGIWVEVMNQNDVIDTTIRSLFTDADGYFDTGSFVWSNCDPICDAPDIYVRYELDTGIVNVQDPSDATEPDYSWSNVDAVITDFPGGFHDFGTLKPANSAVMPALHIHNSVTRAYRFIKSRVGITVPEVDVLWPDGNNASYSSYFQEMKIGTSRQWNEGTHTHEYGHHFLDNFAVNVEPDYCNADNGDTSFCDDASGVPNCYNSATGSCGHCTWCRETDHDAWNEGWPNWLADVITRSYPDDYEFSDCTPWTAMCPRSQEAISTCCQDSQPHDALRTEGFVGALLRDIEDDTQDDHDGDGIQDSLCLGVEAIFAVVTAFPEPTTVAGFISKFLTFYPDLRDELWPTAFNVAPSYVVGVGFGLDAALPGPVPSLFSTSHPLGVGGALPCITVTWTPAPDDRSGVCAYSYEWDTDPSVPMPDTTAETDIDFSGCLPSLIASPQFVGDNYIRIRARDCIGNWSSQASTFGPFTITDCNGSGWEDLCDIRCCDANCTAGPASCSVTAAFCGTLTCETDQDCNNNFVPDDCDIASGASRDCNNNGRPDECDVADGTLIQWVGGSSSSWHDVNNWHKPNSLCPPPVDVCEPKAPEPTCPAQPTAGDDVCIGPPSGSTVVYSGAATQVETLACYGNLNIAGGGFPWAELTLNQASWIDGNLGLSGDVTSLEVVDRLDIAGMFNWTGNNHTNNAMLRGSGVTYANGGVQISDVVHLSGHHLVLDGNSTSVCTGRVDFISPATFEIRPGSTYEHQGSGYILRGWLTDQFVNQGTLVKSVNPGSSSIYIFTNNSGLIHVQAGTLKFSLGGSSTGDFLADAGTTLEFIGGNHSFLAGSSIVAQDVTFTGGASGANNVRGTYNVSGSTSVFGNHGLHFHASADIINYGADLTICGGPVYFDFVFGGPISFNSITITCNSAYFNSGDPINTVTLDTGGGTIRGPSDISVSGLMTWNPGGWIMGPSTINADGGLLVTSGGSEKRLYNRVFNNAATATLLGWFSMSSLAEFNNLVTGVMDIQVDGGVIQGIGQTLNNAGTLVKSAGTGTTTFSVNFTNTGTVEVQTGALAFYGGYGMTNTQTAGQTILNGGDLAFTLGMPFDIQGGVLTGVGTVTGHVANAGGTIKPGLSAGTLDIVGSYTQESGATLEVELGGLGQGTGYDFLNVTGAASLAGTMQIVLIDGFVLQNGQSFDIIASGSVSGTFDNVTGPAEIEVSYGSGSVTLDVVCPAGDIDCDGYVGPYDHATFLDCFAGPGTPPNPTLPTTVQTCLATFDSDADDDVDIEDFAAFARIFDGG